MPRKILTSLSAVSLSRNELVKMILARNAGVKARALARI
jgi:hypothetical protein